jgi:hypothetical protein
MTYFRFVTNYQQNPPRPTLEESLWRVRANETPLGPSWSDWSNEVHARRYRMVIDVVRNMSPTVFTDADLNVRPMDYGTRCVRPRISESRPWCEWS